MKDRGLITMSLREVDRFKVHQPRRRRPALHDLDRLSEVNQGAAVANKRLGHVLEIAQRVQAQRDNRRILACAARSRPAARACASGSILGRRETNAAIAPSAAIRHLRYCPRSGAGSSRSGSHPTQAA